MNADATAFLSETMGLLKLLDTTSTDIPFSILCPFVSFVCFTVIRYSGISNLLCLSKVPEGGCYVVTQRKHRTLVACPIKIEVSPNTLSEIETEETFILCYPIC